MNWYIQNINSISNIVGLTFDIIGAWLVAWEIVKQYKDDKFSEKSMPTFDTNVLPPPAEHPNYKIYETIKYRKMKWGLVFLTVGFILQMFPNICNIIFH